MKKEDDHSLRLPVGDERDQGRASVGSTHTPPEIEAWMVSRLAELLAVSPNEVDAREPLRSYGLGSLQALRLVGDLEERLKLHLSPIALYEHSSIKALASHLAQPESFLTREGARAEDGGLLTGQSRRDGRNPVDDAILDRNIRAGAVMRAPVTEPASILLTGATGYLGAFLLHELLQQSEAKLYCLVRCRDYAEGERRIEENLKSYSLWDESLRFRIIGVPGNLSRPLLGLSLQEFQRLASEIDVIYHSGALVNYLYPYKTLWAPNVLSTQEVLRLSSRVKIKPVHFISTLGVLYSVDATSQRIAFENDQLDGYEALYLGFGYAQSKWVAEKLATEGRSRGLPVSIYRPGLITGDSRTGVWKLDDLLCRLIKGCIELGSAPGLDITLDMVPVDYVSRAIVHLSRQNESLGKTFHLTNPHPLDWHELTAWIRSQGYSLRQVSYDEWQRALIGSIGQGSGNALEALLPFFTERVSTKQMFIPEMYSQAQIPLFDYHNTLKGLKDSAISCVAGAGLLNTYFSYFVRSGFLELPKETAQASLS